MRAEPISLSFEAIASVREVLRTVDEELLAFETPQPTDAAQQSADDITAIYETLLAHGFDVSDVEKALQVQRIHRSRSAAVLTACCRAVHAMRNPAVLLIVDLWKPYTPKIPPGWSRTSTGDGGSPWVRVDERRARLAVLPPRAITAAGQVRGGSARHRRRWRQGRRQGGPRCGAALRVRLCVLCQHDTVQELKTSKLR